MTAMARDRGGRPCRVEGLGRMPADGNRYELTDELLPVAPQPAVEVLSPSNAVVDLTLKKGGYERMGVAGYRLVDPEGTGADRLRAGRRRLLRAGGRGVGRGPVRRDAAVPVRIVLSELLGTSGQGLRE